MCAFNVYLCVWENRCDECQIEHELLLSKSSMYSIDVFVLWAFSMIYLMCPWKSVATFLRISLHFFKSLIWMNSLESKILLHLIKCRFSRIRWYHSLSFAIWRKFKNSFSVDLSVKFYFICSLFFQFTEGIQGHIFHFIF